MNKIFLLLLLLSFVAPRISVALDRITPDTKMDRNKPFPIYMFPGRSTTIELPCSISSVVPGTTGELKAEIGPEKDNSLLVWLLNEQTSATNLVVRCGNRVLIFDIIPSRKSHQDYINITGFETSTHRKNLVSESSNFTESPAYQTRKLIKTSEDK